LKLLALDAPSCFRAGWPLPFPACWPILHPGLPCFTGAINFLRTDLPHSRVSTNNYPPNAHSSGVASNFLLK
jgi:hypothetical protein